MARQLLEQFRMALLVGTEEDVLRAIQTLRQAKVKIPEMAICQSDAGGRASHRPASAKSLYENSDQISEERPQQ